MSKLREKLAANDPMAEVKTLLDRIDGASHELKDAYYALFDNLNALFESYPNLYKQIEMVVKLPSNDDAKDVVQFDQDLSDILMHFKDNEYLESYIQPKGVEKKPEMPVQEPKQEVDENAGQ